MNWRNRILGISRAHERLLLLGIILVISFLVFYALRFQHLYVADQMRREAVISAARSEVQTIQTFTDFYSQNIVPRAHEAGATLTHDMDVHRTSFPYPMSMANDVSVSLSAKRKESFRFYSDWPWAFRTDGGPANVFQRNALDAFASG